MTAGVVGGDEPFVQVARPAAVGTQRQELLSAGKPWFPTIWFFLLLSSICLEGLGRRYLAIVPSAAFYFSKDLILVIGLLRFRVNRDVRTTFSMLYRGFVPYLKLAILWTVAELMNPQHKSLILGILGVRAYWFWWLAPLVVASVLLDPTVRRKAVMLQSAITIVVALLAMLQFGSPVDDAVNMYSLVDGQESVAIEIISTGKVRVSSTFSFISGFADFAILMPVLLLSIGLGEKDRRVRLAALIATLFAAASLPMSGSRSPFILSLALCSMVMWRAGLVFTRTGRRLILAAVLAGCTTMFAFPDAVQGVMDRFDGDDTSDRAVEFFQILPPVALYKFETTFFGMGTGMMQNYRSQLGVSDDLAGAEGEVARYLRELGAPGYILVWIAKLGLGVALWRGSKILKKAGRRAASACAVAYGLLGLYGSLAFDHIYCALFFVGFGFILQEVVQARLFLASLDNQEHGLPATGAKAPA